MTHILQKADFKHALRKEEISMRIETLVLGEIETNCYLVFDEASGAGFVIDPAADAARIVAAIQKYAVKPEAVLLTHGHFDHMMAAGELRERYGIPVYAGEKETGLLADARANLSGLWAEPYTLKADILIRNRQVLTIAGKEILALHTPGHTQGGMSYYLEDEHVLFSGDTLFRESYGRTDFPGGSFAQIKESVQTLLKLPDDTVVYPGHGEETDIAHEKAYNPLSM